MSDPNDDHPLATNFSFSTLSVSSYYAVSYIPIGIYCGIFIALVDCRKRSQGLGRIIRGDQLSGVGLEIDS